LHSPCAMNSLHSYEKKNNEKKRKLLLIDPWCHET
jgi:hypothetical protein